MIQAEGDTDRAAELLKADPQLVGLDPALIFMLIEFALRLFAYWQKNKTTYPEMHPQQGEPQA